MTALRKDAVFNRRLRDLLRKHADAVVMTPPRLRHQRAPDATPMHAVLDKVISRGNPTIVEHLWERRHLDTAAAIHVETGSSTDKRQVGRRLVRPISVRNLRELLEAAESLWLLPYDAVDRPMDRLADDLAGISSPHEDRLYQAGTTCSETGSRAVAAPPGADLRLGEPRTTDGKSAEQPRRRP